MKVRRPIAPPPQQPVETGDDNRPVVPAPLVPDTISRLEPANNTISNNGETVIIDVVPDMRFPLASWIYSISNNVQTSIYSDAPFASPASLLSYTMIMYYGFLFHCDASLRLFNMSKFAHSISNDQAQSQLFDSLLDMHVPSFADYEFSSLQPHNDELATHLHYFASLAGSSLSHDYGRIIPATVFARLHNLLATIPANSGYETLESRFYSQNAMHIVLGPTLTILVTNAQLFGRTILTSGTTYRHANWLNMSIDSMLNANAIRVVNAQATVTRFFIEEPPATALDDTTYNPYLLGIGYTNQNLFGLNRLLFIMNSFIKAKFPRSKPLRAYTQPGTQEIVRHLIFDSVLPTWHTHSEGTIPVPSASSTQGISQLPIRNPTEFASDVNFLVARPSPSKLTVPPAVPLTQGKQPSSDPAKDSIRVDLVSSSASSPDPTENLYRLFSAQRHVTPNMVIFEPSANTPAHLAAVILSGKITETHDISQIGMEIPHPTAPIGPQNSQFIMGSIQLRYIQNAGSQNPLVSRRRNWQRFARIAQTFFISCADKVLLPFFSPSDSTPTAAISSPGNHPEPFLPGVRFNNQVTSALDGINVFSTALGSNHVNLPDQTFRLWTSYRFYDVETNNWYWLPTLRHIYGTRSRLFGSTHPSLRLR
jgi:hypothetical protein